MRILGVVASLRPGGNSELLARTALAAAAARGARTDVVFLRDLDIRFCEGCLACVFGEGCRQSDDVAWLYATAATYDGLILASPAYALGAPGQVKTLVDQGVAEFPRLAARRPRPTGTICVSGRPGWGDLARPVVNQLGALLGGRLVGCVEGRAAQPGEALLDAGLVQRVAELGECVVEGRSLPPPSGVCPVCHAPLVPGPCPFCLHDPAQTSGSGGAGPEHRFTASALTHHLDEWMLPSRQRFLARRHEVRLARERLLEFPIRRVSPPSRGEGRAGRGTRETEQEVGRAERMEERGGAR